jgi:hypothetical protein
MKMIKIPWNFDGELISEDTCLHAYNSDSYESNFFVSSKYFKGIHVHEGNTEHKPYTSSYVVTLILNKGSRLTFINECDEIAYYFTHDEAGKETAYQLIDNIVSQIND